MATIYIVDIYTMYLLCINPLGECSTHSPPPIMYLLLAVDTYPHKSGLFGIYISCETGECDGVRLGYVCRDETCILTTTGTAKAV